jgi:histone deacetylase 1/2
MKQFCVPLLLLGGGGYTIKNVARCWAFETGVSVGDDIGAQAPISDYYEYLAPEYNSEVVSDPSVKDQNDEAYRSKILEKVMHHLSYVQHSPSVAFHERPPDTPDAIIMAIPSVEDGHEVVMGVSRPPQQMWKSPN